MDVLAVDPSKTQTGWARFKAGDVKPLCGHFSSGGPHSTRRDLIGKFYREFTAIVAFPPDLIAFERPLRGDAQSNEDNNRNANAMATIIELVAYAHRIRCTDHDNNTWKSSFFNTDIPMRVKNHLGKSMKNPRYNTKAISLAMCKAFDIDVANHDEADAVGLLDHVLGLEGIIAPWRRDNVLAKA